MEIPHLNHKPSPNWLVPFAASMLLSLCVLIAIETLAGTWSFESVFHSFGSALLATFSLAVLTSLWVAFRGYNRRFLPKMKYRVATVGLICPLIAVVVFRGLEYIGYRVPIQASPDLEALLLSSACTGELLVRFASEKAGPSRDKVG